MRSIKLAGFTLFLAALAGHGPNAHGQTRELSGSGELVDRIAAVVNEGVVLKSEVDQQIEQITERLRAQRTQLPPRNVLRQQILEQLVVQELQLQRAERMGMQVPDEMLNAQLSEMAARNQITLDELPTRLREEGISYADFRDSQRKEMLISGLQRREVVMRIVITPREVDQYLARQNASLEDEDFDVSHILLSVPEAATPEQAQAVQARAQDVYRRASAGEDFARLAVANSNAQTALDGGALGWRRGPELPGFIAGLVAGMQPGDVSEPVRTPSGYQIVKLNDRRGSEDQVIVNQVHARHILVRPTALQDDETVRQKLAALRQRILDGEDFAGLAQTTSEDPGSSAQDGDLGWMDENGFVPEFNKTLATMNEGEISEPFKSPYGWHIAQLLGRRVQDVTEEKQRQQAYSALQASKADEELELWLRRLRDEAYIEYKM
jgi:peptidyl-prolyl cis-trans isomerase SurA